MTPLLVPFIITLAPIIDSPCTSSTLPLIVFCCVILSTISVWSDVELALVAHNDPVAIKASDAPNTILLGRELQCLSFLFISIKN